MQARCQKFSGWGRFHGKIFVKKICKKIQNYKTIFCIKNLSQRRIKSGTFYPQPEPFFRFQKKGRGDWPPFPLVRRLTLVSVDEYASIFLNIPKYPPKCLHNFLTVPRLWICPVILHVRQVFENASDSKCVRVLNMTRLYMQRLHRVLNLSE